MCIPSRVIRRTARGHSSSALSILLDCNLFVVVVVATAAALHSIIHHDKVDGC